MPFGSDLLNSWNYRQLNQVFGLNMDQNWAGIRAMHDRAALEPFALDLGANKKSCGFGSRLANEVPALTHRQVRQAAKSQGKRTMVLTKRATVTILVTDNSRVFPTYVNQQQIRSGCSCSHANGVG